MGEVNIFLDAKVSAAAGLCVIIRSHFTYHQE